MEATLKSVSYGLIVNGKKYHIEHDLIWKKEYPNIALWCTYVNQAMKLNKSGYAQSWRKTMPTKAEMRKHIENNWYPDMKYPQTWSDKMRVWHNPCFSLETLKKYE